MSIVEGPKSNNAYPRVPAHKMVSSALALAGTIWLAAAGHWPWALLILGAGIFLALRPSGDASLPRFQQKLARLPQVLEAITLNPDRGEAVQQACMTAVALSDAQLGALYLYERDPEALVLHAHTGFTPEQQAAWAALPLVAMDAPSGVSNTSRSNDTLAAQAQSCGFNAYTFVPVRRGQTVIGLLALFFTKPTKTSPATLDLLRLLTAHLASYLDRHELSGLLEEYSFEMTQLNQLSRITASSMQLERVLGDVTAMLCDMINASQVSIGLLDRERQILRLYNMDGNYGVALAAAPELGELFGEAAGTRSFPALFDPQEPGYSDRFRQLLVQHGGVRLVVFPMRANDQLLGVMLIGSDRFTTYQDREWEFLELTANQIAAQLQNVMVHVDNQQALHRRLEQLSLIEDIGRQISGILDFDQIIDKMLDAALRATQGDAAVLTLVEADELWTVIQRDNSGATHKTYRSRRRQDSTVEQVMRTRKPVLVEDTRALQDFAPSTRIACQSSVAVPLLQDNVVIGVLTVESTMPRFFNDDQLSFLNSLAGHTVISIRNARLVEDHQYQIRTLRSLQALTLRLSSAVTTQAVAGAVLETAREMLGAQDVALFHFNADRAQLTLLATSGGKRAEAYITAADALPAAQGGDIQVIEKVSNKQVMTLVHMPIRYNGAVREVLSLAFPENRPVRPRDLNSITVLASQTAGHLENAMLHEHIRAGSDRMRAILNSTRDGILLIDRSGFLVDCNPSAERLLGIDKDEFLGKHFVLTLSRITGGEEVEGVGYSRAQLVALARQLRLEPERITSRQFARTVGTQTMYIEEIGSPVLNDRHEIVGRLLVLRDITEQKQLEVYRDEITHMAVHDLRGPLWAVISGITLAQEDLAVLPQLEMTKKTLGVAAQSASGLLKLVDSLMDIAKLETQQMPLQRMPVDLGELIAAAAGSLSGTLEEADIELQTDVAPNLPPLNIDPVIIQRVLVNLLDNAVRHTPAQGKILISARQNRHDVIVRVADSGPGIPAAERDRIFERFRQVKDNIPLRGPKGSGLGLTFCKLAVEAHAGHIWVETDGLLSGACFALSLPTVAVPTASTMLHER